jgi:hypothetical protein
MTSDPPFTPTELSTWLWEAFRIKRGVKRLAKLRQIGGGPPYVRDGVAVRYPKLGARKWAIHQLGKPVKSTAEETVRASDPLSGRGVAGPSEDLTRVKEQQRCVAPNLGHRSLPLQR